MAYITMSTGLSVPVQLLRIPQIVMAILRRCCCGRSRTQREYRTGGCGDSCRAMEDPGEFYQEYYAPFVALNLTIVVAYSAAMPLIGFCGVLYFGASVILWRHQICFVFRKSAGESGMMWPTISTAVILGLVLMQIMSAIVVVLEFKAYITALWFIPLLYLTLGSPIWCGFGSYLYVVTVRGWLFD